MEIIRPHMMYHRHSLKGGWYETLMRPYVVLCRFWYDMGTASPAIIFNSSDSGYVHDSWI